MTCSVFVSRFVLLSFIVVLALVAAQPARGTKAFAAQDPCRTLTPITPNQDVTGKLETVDCRLSDGSFVDFYSFTAVANQQIAVTLNSTEFDAYLALLDSSGNLIREDDDGGGGSNSRIPASSGTITLPTAGTYIIAANSFDGGETGAYTLRLISPTATLASVSAASFSGVRLAPDSITAAFGSGLATQTVSANARPLPTTLGGSRVDVTDAAGQTRPAPLFFVAPQQINYLLPAGTATGVATVKVTSSDGTTTQGAVQVAAVAPGIFAANASGQGVAAAVVLRVRGNVQTFEPVAQFDSATNRFVATPINLGPETDQVILLLFGTGVRNRSANGALTALIGGTSADVLGAAAQAEFDGLDQINVRLPRSLMGRGEVDVALTVDGAAANVVRIRVQ